MCDGSGAYFDFRANVEAFRSTEVMPQGGHTLKRSCFKATMFLGPEQGSLSICISWTDMRYPTYYDL